MPYVRRSVFRRTKARLERVIDALLASPPPASACGLVTVKTPTGDLGPDVCLFVTYSPLPRLKRHVVRHVDALLAGGVKVILIVNTPLAAGELELDPGLCDRLAGLYVRANEGFDFGAWAHVYLLLKDRITSCQRLLLTNDSIVGPLGGVGLANVLERIRRSDADVVGLTDNADPEYHLQSFFLAFQRRALSSPEFTGFWQAVLNLPTKDLVVAVYETRLTSRLSKAGLRCASLFQLEGPERVGANDAYYRWHHLVAAGFPFVKASVLEEFWSSRAVKRLVSPVILDEYEFANTRGSRSRSAPAR